MTKTQAPFELIPATRQRMWGVAAVLNFALGGLGAGLYAAAALASRFHASPTLSLAAWLGPALVIAGFAAVATEAGRPLRGVRVLTRVRTSWMSRELLLGDLFAAAALGEWAVPSREQRTAAVLAALVFVAAQGLIVRHARAVPAWDVPAMPAVFVVSALVSGAGFGLVAEAARGVRPHTGLLGGALAVIIVGSIVWQTYVTWSREPAFARPTVRLREGPGARLSVVGYLMPAVALVVALALPRPGLAALAGLLMIAGQAWAKWLLIVTVATLRPVTVETLQFGRRVT